MLIHNKWPSAAIDQDSSLELSETIFLELKSKVVVATARSATEYSVPAVVESTHSAKVAAPRVVETASLPDVEDSYQLDVG